MKKVTSLFALLLLFYGSTCLALSEDSTKYEAPDSVKSRLKIDPGMDLVNNFIWRGVPLDPGPCLQPAMIMGYKNLELAFLGSYSLRHDFNNILTILSYNIKGKYGTITPMLLDYYYPYDRVKLTELKDDTLSFTHTMETGIQFKGDKIPLRIYACVNVHNDPDHSTYLEAGYSFYTNGVRIEPFFGAVFNASPAWQGADKPGILNLGLAAEKSLKISEHYSLPIKGLLSYHSQLDMLNISVRLSIF